MNPNERLWDNPHLGIRQKQALSQMGLKTVRDLAEATAGPSRLDLLLDALALEHEAGRTAFIESVTSFFPSTQKSGRQSAMGCLFRDQPEANQAKASPTLIHDEVQSLQIPRSASLVEESRTSGVRNQSQRATCVAMATTKVLDVLFGRGMQFSPQYLYWRMKELANFPDEMGLTPTMRCTFLRTMVAVWSPPCLTLVKPAGHSKAFHQANAPTQKPKTSAALEGFSTRPSLPTRVPSPSSSIFSAATSRR